MQRVSWDEIKDLSIVTKEPLRYVDRGDIYYITLENWAYCKLPKSEATEFEDDFKAAANAPFSMKDTDGANIVNPKLAGNNRRYLSTFINFKTSDLSSVVSNGWDLEPLGIASMKTYKADASEITDNADKAEAVCTVLTVANTKTFDIQGFCLYQKEQPSEDVYIYGAIAPHISKENGGCVEAIQGCNLRYANSGNREMDWVGDSASKIEYDPVNFSHTMAIKLIHPAGLEHHIQVEVIWYV